MATPKNKTTVDPTKDPTMVRTGDSLWGDPSYSKKVRGKAKTIAIPKDEETYNHSETNNDLDSNSLYKEKKYEYHPTNKNLVVTGRDIFGEPVYGPAPEVTKREHIQNIISQEAEKVKEAKDERKMNIAKNFFIKITHPNNFFGLDWIAEYKNLPTGDKPTVEDIVYYILSEVNKQKKTKKPAMFKMLRNVYNSSDYLNKYDFDVIYKGLQSNNVKYRSAHKTYLFKE